MKCKEKEDLIEIRVTIINSVIIIINSVIINSVIIMTMITVCKTRTDFCISESTCLRPRATNS